jgi:DNA-binding PadR family transcriptional regulator
VDRLERAGLLASRWAEVKGRRRRIYQVTRKGARAPARQHTEWRNFVGWSTRLWRAEEEAVTAFGQPNIVAAQAALGQKGHYHDMRPHAVLNRLLA